MQKALRQAAAIALLTWVMLAICSLSINGCAAGTTGLARPLSDEAYSGATNALGTATQIVTAATPAPWAEVFRIAAGVAIAGLTAWQSWTHSRVTKLTNGTTPIKNKTTA